MMSPSIAASSRRLIWCAERSQSCLSSWCSLAARSRPSRSILPRRPRPTQVRPPLRGPARTPPLTRPLHHPRPGQRGPGHAPQRPGDTRTGPRRPEGPSPGPPPCGEVHRDGGLARPSRDGVQPHPRRRHPGRADDGQSHHRDHPPQARQRPSPDRVLGPTNDTAPTACLALGERVDHPLHRTVRTTASSRDDLTAPPHKARRRTSGTPPTARSQNGPRPIKQSTAQARRARVSQAHRWIEA